MTLYTVLDASVSYLVPAVDEMTVNELSAGMYGQRGETIDLVDSEATRLLALGAVELASDDSAAEVLAQERADGEAT